MAAIDLSKLFNTKSSGPLLEISRILDRSPTKFSSDFFNAAQTVAPTPIFQPGLEAFEATTLPSGQQQFEVPIRPFQALAPGLEERLRALPFPQVTAPEFTEAGFTQAPFTPADLSRFPGFSPSPFAAAAPTEAQFAPGELTGAAFTPTDLSRFPEFRSISPGGLDTLEKALFERQRSLIEPEFERQRGRLEEGLTLRGLGTSLAPFGAGGELSAIEEAQANALQRAGTEATLARVNIELQELARQQGLDLTKFAAEATEAARRTGFDETEAARRTAFAVSEAARRTGFSQAEAARLGELAFREATRQTEFNLTERARQQNLDLTRFATEAAEAVRRTGFDATEAARQTAFAVGEAARRTGFSEAEVQRLQQLALTELNFRLSREGQIYSAQVQDLARQFQMDQQVIENILSTWKANTNTLFSSSGTEPKTTIGGDVGEALGLLGGALGEAFGLPGATAGGATGAAQTGATLAATAKKIYDSLFGGGGQQEFNFPIFQEPEFPGGGGLLNFPIFEEPDFLTNFLGNFSNAPAATPAAGATAEAAEGLGMAAAPVSPLLPTSVRETSLPVPSDIDFTGSFPPTIAAPTDLDFTGSFPPSAGGLVPATQVPPTVVAPTDLDFIGSMPSSVAAPTSGGGLLDALTSIPGKIESGIGLPGGTLLPGLGLLGGLTGLLTAEQPGQKIAAGAGAVGSGAALAGNLGLISQSTASLLSPLGPLAAIPGIASLFGAFKGPNRSQTFNRSIELDIRPKAEQYLGSGGMTSNLGDGGVGNLYGALDSSLHPTETGWSNTGWEGVPLDQQPGLSRMEIAASKAYLQIWEPAAKEVGALLGGGTGHSGDPDRAAAAILTSIFSKSMDPRKVSLFLASMGASPETLSQAYPMAVDVYGRDQTLLDDAFGRYSRIWESPATEASFRDAITDGSPDSLEIARRVGPETLGQWGYELVEDPDNPRGGYLRPLNYREGSE